MRLQPTDALLSAHLVLESDCVSSISIHGHLLTCLVSAIPLLAGAGQGVRLVKLGEQDWLIAVSPQLPLTLETDQGKPFTLDKHGPLMARSGKGKPIIKKGLFRRISHHSPAIPTGFAP